MTEHPLHSVAGSFDDEPLWDEFQAAVKEYRERMAWHVQPSQRERTMPRHLRQGGTMAREDNTPDGIGVRCLICGAEVEK